MFAKVNAMGLVDRPRSISAAQVGLHKFPNIGLLFAC